MIKNVVGSVVTGGDFSGREQQQRQIWQRLQTDNILFLAPRRVGKTSLLHRLVDTAAQEGYRAVYLTVSHQVTEIDLLKTLYDAVAQAKNGRKAINKIWKILQARLPRLPGLRKISIAKVVTIEFAEGHAKHWQIIGDALFETLRGMTDRWLVMIDEIPRFVLALISQDRERARVFLNWFRALRTDQQSTGIRWLLCGSIGLDTVAQRERLSDTINDLAIVHLGPFSDEEAHGLLADLAQSYGMSLSEAVRSHICYRVGWLIPYHLQVIFAGLTEHAPSAPSAADVNTVYQQLLTASYKTYFDYWVQRLQDELGPVDAEHALAILAMVAPDNTGASTDTLRALLFDRDVDKTKSRFLLDVLETDGYLVKHQHRYIFRSPLLRDYWRARVLP